MPIIYAMMHKQERDSTAFNQLKFPMDSAYCTKNHSIKDKIKAKIYCSKCELFLCEACHVLEHAHSEVK